MQTYSDTKTRFVRKDRRIYGFSTCRLCGSAHGVVRPEIEHRLSFCAWCGTPQCQGNGSGNGCCPVCHHGLLSGWFHAGELVCGFAGCGKPAVARGIRGKRYVCVDHAARQFGAGYLERALEARGKEWLEVEQSPCSPYAPQTPQLP